MPAGHVVHVVAAAALNVPTAQLEHVAAAAPLYVPATHVAQSADASWAEALTLASEL